MEDLAQKIDGLTERAYYLCTEPETLDFTLHKEFRFVIYTRKEKITKVIDLKNLPVLLGLLRHTIYEQKDALIFWWDLKQFNSFCLYHLKKLPKLSGFDLKVIEGFQNIRKKKPENLNDVINRLKVCGNWKSTYTKLHDPLINEVIPSIETCGLLNTEKRQSEFSYYEIEGTQHGRLLSEKLFNKSFLPHTLTPEDKTRLIPRDFQIFVYADIKSCEMTTLQYLTKDEILSGFNKPNQDMYRQIYELITSDPCNTDRKRQICKDMILPVIYGCGAERLSELIDLSSDGCKDLIYRMKRVFKTAFDWLEQKQYEAKNGPITDLFGRVRDLTDAPYKARNFLVQGAAATVCQEKLVDLYHAISGKGKLCFTLHDGFGIVAPIPNVKEIVNITRKVLESESKLCPGLFYRSDIKFGARLDSLKIIKEKND